MKEFFKSASHNLRNLIISRKGLIEHTKRACLQAGWLWRECETKQFNDVIETCSCKAKSLQMYEEKYVNVKETARIE